RTATLVEEFLDEAPLTLTGHRFTDDLAGGSQGEVGDLGPEIGNRPLLLGLDLRDRLNPQSLELGLGCGDICVAALLGDPLGPIEDLLHLSTNFLEHRQTFGLNILPIDASLLYITQPLLDPCPPV